MIKVNKRFKYLNSITYNEQIAARMGETIQHIPNLEERYRMGGLAFMVNGKMFIDILAIEWICHIDPTIEETVLEKRDIG